MGASTQAAGAPALRARRYRRLGLARGFSFVGGRKATLRRVLREKGVVLTIEARARFDALPEQFLDFNTAPESFAAQLEAEAA
jgi:hypothetical protein